MRIDNWQKRLIDLVEDRRDKPYEYGVTDCACFSFAAIEALTGMVPFPSVPRPKSWIGAAKFMMSRGWSGVDEMMDSFLKRTEPDATEIGDLVAFRSCGELHLAVRAGDLALSPGDTGLMTIDKSRWVHGWKVG